MLARLDIHKSTLYNWLSRYHDGNLNALALDQSKRDEQAIKDLQKATCRVGCCQIKGIYPERKFSKTPEKLYCPIA